MSMAHSSCFINPEEMFILYSTAFRFDHGLKLHELKDKQLQALLSWDYVSQNVVTATADLSHFISYFENVILARHTTRVPIAVTFTYEIIKAVLGKPRDYESLSLSLTRSLNQIVDLSQNSKKALSFVQSLRRLKVHEMICDIASETRHSIVHKAFPSRQQIDLTSIYFLIFLKENFWDKTLAANCQSVCQQRMKWTLRKMNGFLESNISMDVVGNILQNLKPPAKYTKGRDSKVIDNSEEEAKFANEVRKELDSKNPSSLSLSTLISESRVSQKKYRACLTIIEDLWRTNDSTVAMKKAEFIGKFFLEHVNVSDFRSFFSKREFIGALRHVLVFKSVRKDFEELWQALESHYKKILLTSPFILNWLKPVAEERADEFDIGLFKRLDDQYNTCEIFEKMSRYYKVEEESEE
jgi:hypothetical protein